jgi:hypothetical protein
MVCMFHTVDLNLHDSMLNFCDLINVPPCCHRMFVRSDESEAIPTPCGELIGGPSLVRNRADELMTA